MRHHATIGSSSDLFRANALFHGMSPKIISEVLMTSKYWEADQDELVIREGETGPYDIFLVGSGQLCVLQQLPSGENKPLITFPAGHFFGEMASLTGLPRSADVKALEPSIVAAISESQVRRIMQSEPDTFLRNIVRVLVERTLLNKSAISQAYIYQSQLAAIGMLTSELAHDLRGTLVPVSMIAGLLADNEKLFSDSERAQKLRRAVSSATGMIEDILSFVSEKPRRAKERVLISDLIVNIDEMGLQPLEGSGRIEVQRHVDVTGTIVADALGLERVALNLIRNARDSMSSAGRLTFEAKSTDTDLLLTVSDTGRGIPADRIPSLFQPFSTFGKQGGTGLGLAIARRTVESHQGDISVQSEIGVGTCFRIRIPRG